MALKKPRSRTSPGVTRAEFDRLRKRVDELAELLRRSLPTVEANSRAREVQLRRIGQMQAELDDVKRAIGPSRQRISEP